VALDPQLVVPMIHEIVVEHISGTTGGYAQRVYNTASTFKARIEFLQRLVKDANGRDVVSNTRIFTPMYDADGSTSATITVSDRITLPSHFIPRQPPIISVEPHYDHEGPHHYEVYL
jgi:hypothetical protein